MPPKHLRPVAPDEGPPAPKVPLTLAEAVEGGDYLEILRAQRRDIVASLQAEKGPALAALHRQLALLSKEIEALELQRMPEVSDERSGPGDERFDASAL